MQRFYHNRRQFRSEHRRRQRRKATKKLTPTPPNIIDERPKQLQRLGFSLSNASKEKQAARALEDIAHSCAELVLKDPIVQTFKN